MRFTLHIQHYLHNLDTKLISNKNFYDMKQTKQLRHILRRMLFCLTLIVMCAATAQSANFNKGTVQYFKISHTGWPNDGAWFVANFHDGNETSGNYRQQLQHVDGNYYYCVVPEIIRRSDY